MSCSAARGAFLAEMLDAAVKAKARLGTKTKGPASRSWLHPWGRLRTAKRFASEPLSGARRAGRWCRLRTRRPRSPARSPPPPSRAPRLNPARPTRRFAH
jgi:hypothetical protein